EDVDNTFIIHNNQFLEGGEVAVMIVGDDKPLAGWQVGEPFSGGWWRNTFMVTDTYGIVNTSILSDCREMIPRSGAVRRLSCNTSRENADFFVAGSEQIAGMLFIGGSNRTESGIESRGVADFIMEGHPFVIAEGNLEIVNNRSEVIGLEIGQEVNKINNDFEDFVLEPFVVSSDSGDIDEWEIETHSTCFFNECIHASRVTGGTTIVANFSTTDEEIVNISFIVSTIRLDPGDVFNATLDNNAGVVVELKTITDGTDATNLVVFNATIPQTFSNKSVITLKYDCIVNANNEHCGVDNILVRVNASDSTTETIKLDEGTMFLGDRTCFMGLIVNASTEVRTLTLNCEFINLIGNVTETTINTVSEDVSGDVKAGSFTLNQTNPTTIFSWFDLEKILDFVRTADAWNLANNDTSATLSQLSTNITRGDLITPDNTSWITSNQNLNTTTEMISATTGKVNSTSWNNTGTAIVTADQEKNVGIGTAVPDSKFHIKANIPGTIGSHSAGQLIIQDPD
ncbi:hypothetical protein LCGC14_2459160, partial [marine sediment metagenome]